MDIPGRRGPVHGPANCHVGQAVGTRCPVTFAFETYNGNAMKFAYEPMAQDRPWFHDRIDKFRCVLKLDDFLYVIRLLHGMMSVRSLHPRHGVNN